jgi:hypothetical protein
MHQLIENCDEDAQRRTKHNALHAHATIQTPTTLAAN